MANLDRPKRLTSQKQQEHVSRGQLVEALQGWICNSLGEDFGEDFFVSIYEDGRSTGLAFQLQLKSTSSLPSLIPKRASGAIRYPLNVTDLEHWEDASPPVVIVVWDVVQRRGYWQDIPAIIESLSKLAPAWRTRGTATVTIPVDQSLDHSGRRELRERIGRLVLPAISTGKELVIQTAFRFPDTPDGRASLASLRRGLEDGDEVTIAEENISRFKMSPWWERIFGSTIPTAVTISPRKTDLRVEVYLEAVAEAGLERAPVTLKCVKAGARRAAFANEDGDDLFTVELRVDDVARELLIQASFSHPHPKVGPCLLLTKMMLILRSGGILRAVLPDATPIGILPFDAQRLPEVETLRSWERLLTMIAFIQTRTSRYGLFSVPAGFTREDIEAANRLRLICSAAQEERRMTFELTLKAPPDFASEALTAQKLPEFSVEIDPFGDIELFGVTIPMGRVRVEFLDDAAVLRELSAAQKSKRTKLRFKDARVRLLYLEWVPPHEGPARTAASRRLPAASRSRKRLPPVKKEQPRRQGSAKH